MMHVVAFLSRYVYYCVPFLLCGHAYTQPCHDMTPPQQPTTFVIIRNAVRTGFNNVALSAGTQVLGPYWFNWTAFVSTTAYVDTTAIGSGQNQGNSNNPIIGNLAYISLNEQPSARGTGTYRNYNYHRSSCDIGDGLQLIDEDWTSAFLPVSTPQISQLPYNNSLWYFGPNTPQAVPVLGGYAYQFANLGFEKNCLPNDNCAGTVVWSKLDPLDLISLSSVGRLESKKEGTCIFDSTVRATLDGWQITADILVNSPTGLIPELPDQTVAWGSDGFETRKFWRVIDACPEQFGVGSVAHREQFGMFSNPGVVSGWPDPETTSASEFNYSQYAFIDHISSHGSYNPQPMFTSGQAPFTYNSIIKFAPQSWFVGSQAPGAGLRVFNGEIRYYRDHGDSSQQ
ncbi:MAG: hypothetical protein IT170_08710 [Bryobacterales bacterium]|nr:hypothetical protein [Bryobacterales bacterium]